MLQQLLKILGPAGIDREISPAPLVELFLRGDEDALFSTGFQPGCEAPANSALVFENQPASLGLRVRLLRNSR